MLIFVRHAPTAHNSSDPAKDRTRGQLALAPTLEGRQIAVDTGERFRGIPLSEVYSSDMPAASIVGEEISGITGAPLTLTPALRSWHLGELAGQPTAATVEAIKSYMRTPDRAIPGGESWNQFLDRYLGFLAPQWQQPGYAALVTHGRNIMVARAWLTAGPEGRKLDGSTLEGDYSKFVKHGAWVASQGDRVLDGFR
jgi:broad specificity phosphatase PhoE